MYNVEVESIKEVELSVLEFPQVAVFRCPDDYPKKMVARVFDNGKPTNVVIVSDDMGSLQEDIETNTSFLFFPRGKEDVPALVGVYL